MQALLKLSRGIDWLNTQVGKYVVWLILASTLISGVNAIVRKAFNISSNGFLEIRLAKQPTERIRKVSISD